MKNYFETLTDDYENAEISSVVLHNRKTGEWNNLLTVIELIPSEQEPSLIIGTAATNYCDRLSIDNNYTVYIGRRIICPVSFGIETFRNPESGILLLHESSLNCRVTIFNESVLEPEPASEFPLLINGDTENTIGLILPKRQTAFRVWTRIDKSKNWLALLNEKQMEKLFVNAGLLTKKHMGFDFSTLREHAGNVYLCGCNPYLRRFESTLLDLNSDLLISFHERTGKTIIGKKIVLEDKRADNLSFSTDYIINSTRQRILMPHHPDELCTKIYDQNGYLIENRLGRWVNMSIQMGMQTAELTLTVKSGQKKKQVKVPKYSSLNPVKVGSYDKSLAHYFGKAQELRKLSSLERTGDFIFFPGNPEDKERARDAITELLKKARKVCMLLDPYFGAPDLYYAYLIQNTSLPIQILSSAAFLKSKVKYPSGKSLRQAFLFNRSIKKFKHNLPFQKLDVKVLLGSKSPLHDRYIVIDEKVYLLGSSFNEFGSRATTLIKVPNPEPLIEQALKWWDDSLNVKSIEDYLESLKQKK